MGFLRYPVLIYYNMLMQNGFVYVDILKRSEKGGCFGFFVYSSYSKVTFPLYSSMVQLHSNELLQIAFVYGYIVPSFTKLTCNCATFDVHVLAGTTFVQTDITATFEMHVLAGTTFFQKRASIV